jgi:hypothetical protein
MPFTKKKPSAIPSRKRPIKSEPIWDLYRDGLTQGSIQTFLEDREHFRLHVMEGWSKKVTSDPIEFGSCFHDALARIHTDGLGPKAAIKAYRKKSIQLAGLTDKEIKQLEVIHKTVEMMLPKYLEFWKKTDKERKWVERERVFKTLYDTRISDLDSPDDTYFIPLTGRKDGIFDDKYKEAPGLYLHEMKTKGRIDEDGIRDSLPFDLQTGMYCYCAEQELGKPIRGVVYDLVRQPGHRMTLKDKTVEMFVDRIAADIDKDPAHYFIRFRVIFSPDDIERFVTDQLDKYLAQIVRWYEAIKVYGHTEAAEHYFKPGSLFTRYGGRSDLFDLITKNSPFGLYKRKIPFPELED